jgi:hypothetical protein
MKQIIETTTNQETNKKQFVASSGSKYRSSTKLPFILSKDLCLGTKTKAINSKGGNKVELKYLRFQAD